MSASTNQHGKSFCRYKTVQISSEVKSKIITLAQNERGKARKRKIIRHRCTGDDESSQRYRDKQRMQIKRI